MKKTVLAFLLLYSVSANAYYDCTVAISDCEAQATSNNIAFPGYPDYCETNSLTGEVQLIIVPENTVSNTYSCELLTPPDYECLPPKEWIQTVENDWKCSLVANIPVAKTPNTEGVYGAAGNYHTTDYLPTQICDPANTYECTVEKCSFWTDLTNAVCSDN